MAEFKQGTCDTDWCPNDRRKISPFCSACAAGHTRAAKLGPAWVIQRQEKLNKWQSRMIFVGTERVHTKGFKDAARFVKKHSGRT